MTRATERWKETTLWQLLAQRTAARAEQLVLENWMPRIEAVLGKAETAPADFTLHDEDHSARVAEWMVKLIPAEVLPHLCATELTLLLLSAYLHDIGMTPRRAQVLALRDYLATGEGALTDAEREEFVRWLDGQGMGRPPLLAEAPTAEELRLVDRLVAYYVRHRHNEESAAFVRALPPAGPQPLYQDWVEDLILLGQSHHYGYEELHKTDFDPRPVGSGGGVVHRRYLACVLRVADILENDPARTPEVILQHRDVADASLLYWRKDHEAQITLEPVENTEDRQVRLYGRPRAARIHFALHEMAQAIESELKLCRRLSLEMPFDRHRGRRLPHRWTVWESVDVDLAPVPGTYEYMDGRFRPDVVRLLELLGGTQLYGDRMAALRELLQNAFDAVKERLARERLQGDPRDLPRVEALAQSHEVWLRLEEGADGRMYLVCRDEGVGMTRAIIRDYLLVSGREQRPELLTLERACERAGFRMGRTGQFGIGFLSYFMLADEVTVLTRRAQVCPDHEADGWCFTTSGIGAFGELKKAPAARVGTEVRLRLRREVWLDWQEWQKSGSNEMMIDHEVPFSTLQREANPGDPTKLFRWLKFNLRQILHHVPCKFHWSYAGQEEHEEHWSAGWMRTKEECCGALLQGLRAELRQSLRSPLPVDMDAQIASLMHGEISPNAHKHDQALDSETEQLIQGEILPALRWLRSEGDLPTGAGRYRLLIPYFELADGLSCVFLRTGNRIGDAWELSPLHSKASKAGSFTWIPAASIELTLREGWKGFRSTSPLEQLAGRSAETFEMLLGSAFIDINWEKDTSCFISVDRRSLHGREGYERVLDWLCQEVRNQLQEFARETAHSPFAVPNHCLADLPVPDEVPLLWCDEEGYRWAPLRFPLLWTFPWLGLMDSDPGRNEGSKQAEPYWQGTRIRDVPYVARRSLLSLECTPPERVLQWGHQTHMLVGLWTVRPQLPSRAPDLLTARFAPSWGLLAGAEWFHFIRGYTHEPTWVCLANPDNPLVNRMNRELLPLHRWGSFLRGDGGEPNAFRHAPAKRTEWQRQRISQLLDRPGDAAAWLWHELTTARPFSELEDEGFQRETLVRVWDRAFTGMSNTPSHLLFWRYGDSSFGDMDTEEPRLMVIRRDGWQIVHKKHEMDALLPDPGPEWRISLSGE